MDFEALFKEAERNRAERHRASVRRGIQFKADKGYVVGTLPIGYTAERTRKGSLARLRPELAPFLRRAFEMVMADCRPRDIADWLALRGVTGKRGNSISLSTVMRMLTDPFYSGLAKNGDGHLIRGLHEPVVDFATFSEVQQKLQSQKRKAQ